MMRIESDRCIEIRQSVRTVALLAPNLAAIVERVSLRRIELQCRVVIGNGAVIVLLAVVSRGAGQHRPDPIWLHILFIANQRVATRYDRVVIVRGHSGQTRRSVDSNFGTGLVFAIRLRGCFALRVIPGEHHNRSRNSNRQRRARYHGDKRTSRRKLPLFPHKIPRSMVPPEC
jgi:hypothetical protein